ncbi:hypothetical protein PV682_25125 [Streptomyces niveiscabiei]|uniref:hypothetical protein n=1 Tax=Streptomyces niveiscabiei TaxID=164115 RepID=UPI0029A002BC|nr:hypothetical protein [Streptomyces niveiscabiei]MDX3384726.1 hypothetical protein [Streptomyces niveiscabiei]
MTDDQKPVDPGDVIRTGSPESTVDRVADFYGAYIDAVYDGTDGLGRELRAHYLTEELRRRLADWEETNHADGVLRAQNVPLQWEVRYSDSGAGHAFTVVTLTWGGGTDPERTRLAIQSDLATRLISDIKESTDG